MNVNQNSPIKIPFVGGTTRNQRTQLAGKAILIKSGRERGSRGVLSSNGASCCRLVWLSLCIVGTLHSHLECGLV